MGKRAREERRKAGRLRLIQGGAPTGADDSPMSDAVVRTFVERTRPRMDEILDSDRPADETARDLCNLFDGDVVPPPVIDVLHERSPQHARAVAEIALDSGPTGVTALSIASRVAELDGNASRVLSLLEAHVDESSHPTLRLSLAAALNQQQRIIDAAAILEPLAREFPEFDDAQEELGFAVIAADVRVSSEDGKTWPCGCGSGRPYQDCCKEPDIALRRRFQDREAFDAFRARVAAYAAGPAFTRMRERARVDFFGDEPVDVTTDTGEAGAAMERAFLVYNSAGKPGPGGSVLDRFLRDPAVSSDDRRRAEQWLHAGRYGLWRVTGEANPPGTHVEDLLTGAAKYVSVAPAQVEGLSAAPAFLGLVLPFDGVWRTGATIFPLDMAQADEIRHMLLDVASEVVPPSGHVGELSVSDLVSLIREIREGLKPGVPPPESLTPPEVCSLLSYLLAVQLPHAVKLLRVSAMRGVTLTNTSGELFELITARVAVDDARIARARLLSRPDFRESEDGALLWEGDELPEEAVEEMLADLRRKGLKVEDDGSPRSVILGRIEVERAELIVDVNSNERLERLLGILSDIGLNPRVTDEDRLVPPRPPMAREAVEARAWLRAREPLPLVESPDPETLTAATAAAVVPMRIRALLELLGKKGRKLTPNGNLKLADARALAEAMNEPFDTVIGTVVFRTRSAAEVRAIEETFAWARAAGLIRVVHGWARPTKRAGSFGKKPVDDWWMLFDAFVHRMLWPMRRGLPAWWQESVCDLIPRYLEEVLRLGQALADALAERTLLLLALEYQIPPADRDRIQSWISGDIAYAIMRPLGELGALEVIREPLIVGGRATEHDSIVGARTTPLGAWATHRLLTEASPEHS